MTGAVLNEGKRSISDSSHLFTVKPAKESGSETKTTNPGHHAAAAFASAENLFSTLVNMV